MVHLEDDLAYPMDHISSPTLLRLHVVDQIITSPIAWSNFIAYTP